MFIAFFMFAKCVCFKVCCYVYLIELLPLDATVVIFIQIM